MGKIFAMFAMAALSGQAELKDATEVKERAHRAYVAGRYAEAEAGYRLVLAALGKEHTMVRAAAMENLGESLRSLGRVDEARPLMEEAARELTALGGADSPEAMQAASNLAGLYWSAGDLAKAETMAMRAGNHKMLAMVWLAQHRYQEATNLLLTLLESADEKTSVSLYGNLAAASIGMEDLAQAEVYAQRSVTIADCVLPRNHPGRAAVLNNRAQVYRFTGRYLEAETDYREALAIWEQAVGLSHPDYARVLLNLAAFYHDRGREAGAEQLYLRALAILEAVDPMLSLVARNELADVLRAQVRYTEARKLARSTLAQMEGVLPADDARLVRAKANWARLVAEVKLQAQ
jgi:tetratricopeptide (TPR) repeat protein